MQRFPPTSPSPIGPGLRSPHTISATGIWKMRVCWRKKRAAIPTPGRTCVSSCRCSSRKRGTPEPRTAMREAGNRYAMSTTCAAIATCWNGPGAARAQRRSTSRLAPRLEEAPQQGAAFLAAHPPEHVDPVRHFGVARDIEDAAARAGFGVPGAEHHPGDARIDGGADAHGAGLQGHVENRALETIVPQL